MIKLPQILINNTYAPDYDILCANGNSVLYIYPHAIGQVQVTIQLDEVDRDLFVFYNNAILSLGVTLVDNLLSVEIDLQRVEDYLKLEI